MRRILATFTLWTLIATANLLVAASPAGACSCSGEIDDAAAFDFADAVFIGQLDRIQPARVGEPVKVAILDVSDVFKGDVDRLQGIVTPESSASCDFDFLADELYIVYGSSESNSTVWGVEDGFYAARSCTSTRAIETVAELDFDASSAPPNDAGPPSAVDIRKQLGDPNSSLFPEAFIFVGVLGFVLGLAAWLSRKSRPAI